MANLSQEVGLIVIVVAFLLLVAVGIVALVLVYQKKQNQYILEKKQLHDAFEKEILEAQVSMQEQTLKHIAQEIHDNIGQTLTLAKLNLYTIKPDQGSVAEDKIINTKELVTKAIGDLRTLSKTLHTEAVLSAGLLETLQAELSLTARAGIFKTDFTVSGDFLNLDPKKELILFRIVQEALNNSIKHSGALLIQIKVNYLADTLQLLVIDNGKGFNRSLVQASVDKGSGLRNMQNRARLIGGNLTIKAGTEGTQIEITVPITTT